MLSTITLYKLPAEIKLIVRLNINEVNLWDLRESLRLLDLEIKAQKVCLRWTKNQKTAAADGMYDFSTENYTGS